MLGERHIHSATRGVHLPIGMKTRDRKLPPASVCRPRAVPYGRGRFGSLRRLVGQLDCLHNARLDHGVRAAAARMGFIIAHRADHNRNWRGEQLWLAGIEVLHR